MKEKRTFGEFVKANKGKIITGTLIVAGVVAGVILIKKLSIGGEALIGEESILNNVLGTNGTDGILDTIGNITDVAEVLVD